MAHDVTWKTILDERERFIGGWLQDLDPEMGSSPDTKIIDVRTYGSVFVIDGEHYTCRIDTDYGLIGTENDWYLVAAPDVRWRFKARGA